jgi:hypothetical protein
VLGLHVPLHAIHRCRRTGALELGRGDADRLHRRWI